MSEETDDFPSPYELARLDVSPSVFHAILVANGCLERVLSNVDASS